jgi:hypothetical protein
MTLELAQASSAIRPLTGQNELVGNLCGLSVTKPECDVRNEPALIGLCAQGIFIKNHES